MSEEIKSPVEKPRYQILEKCYLTVDGPGGAFERVLDPDTMPDKRGDDGLSTGERVPLVVAYEGVPAYYMKPVNAAARKMCEKHSERMRGGDPLEQLTIVGAAPAVATAA